MITRPLLKSALAALFSLTISSPSAVAKPFDGMYLGGNTSHVQRENTFKSPEAQTTYRGADCKTGGLHTNKKASYLTYGALAGIGKRFANNFYVGTEVAFETHNVITDASLNTYLSVVTPSASPTGTAPGGIPATAAPAPTTPVLNAPPLTYDVNVKTKYERGKVLSLSVRSGVVLENETLVYAKVSLEHSRDTAKSSYTVTLPHASVTEHAQRSKNNLVVVPAVGIEKSLGAFHVRMEYHYNPGRSIEVGHTLGNKRLTEKHAYKAHLLKGAIIYHF